MTRLIAFEVNGRTRKVAAEPRTTLADCLRDHLGLKGTKIGCEHGVCGACSILLDDDPVRSCLIFAVQAEGCRVTTVEGLLEDNGALGILQDAFWEMHALQCGYCTAGMLITAHDLLRRNCDPDEAAVREAIAANLCRCTGYVQIVEAIRLAASRMRQEPESGHG